MEVIFFFFFRRNVRSLAEWLNKNLVFGGRNFIFVNGFEVSQGWLPFLCFSRSFQEDCDIAQPLTTIVPDSPSTEDVLQSCSIWLKFRGTCTGTKIKKSTGKIIPATWLLSNVKRKKKKQGKGVKNCCLNLSHSRPITTICLRSCSLVISLYD